MSTDVVMTLFVLSVLHPATVGSTKPELQGQGMRRVRIGERPARAEGESPS